MIISLTWIVFLSSFQRCYWCLDYIIDFAAFWSIFLPLFVSRWLSTSPRLGLSGPCGREVSRRHVRRSCGRGSSRSAFGIRPASFIQRPAGNRSHAGAAVLAAESVNNERRLTAAFRNRHRKPDEHSGYCKWSLLQKAPKASVMNTDCQSCSQSNCVPRKTDSSLLRCYVINARSLWKNQGRNHRGGHGGRVPVRPTMSPLHQSDNRQFVFGADFWRVTWRYITAYN